MADGELFSTIRRVVFKNLFKQNSGRKGAQMDAKKKTQQGGATAFRLVIRPGEAHVRKKTAPAVRAMPPARLKKPRRRPDWIAEALDE